MMHSLLSNILSERGDETPFTIQQLTGGRNNRAYRVSSGKQEYFVKFYLPEIVAQRRNLEHEVDFLRYANRVTPGKTPRLLYSNTERSLLITEFIEGERLRRKITGEDVSEAARWIRDLNTESPSLLPATDACSRNQDHFDGVARRLDTITSVALKTNNTMLMEFLDRLKQDHASLKKQAFSLPENHKQIVSPSDFGFHNILYSSGHPVFFDFEYAGLDDPAKLICDFFCQPDFPVPFFRMELFLEYFTEDLSERHLLETRIRSLYPLHRIKWSCILLNELLPDRAKSRVFSKSEDVTIEFLLRRVKKYYGSEI